MAWRVTPQDVRDIIDTDANKTVDPFIRMATALTDKVVAADSDGLLGDGLPREIELNLSAHFYEAHDQQYTEKETDDAQAKFQGQFGMGLKSTKYGQNALLLDLTGYLRALGKGGRVGATWLGRPPSEQTAYVNRD